MDPSHQRSVLFPLSTSVQGWAAGPGLCSPLIGVRPSETGLACPLHGEGGPSEKSPPWLGRTGQALPKYEDSSPESCVTSGSPPVLSEVLLGTEHRAGLSSPPGAGDTEVRAQGPHPQGPNAGDLYVLPTSLQPSPLGRA